MYQKLLRYVFLALSHAKELNSNIITSLKRIVYTKNIVFYFFMLYRLSAVFITLRHTDQGRR